MAHMRHFTLSTLAANALPPWWEKIDDDARWQEYSFLGLAVGYGLIALVAIIQLIRIQRRVPEYGWTTQKVFHLLNAFVCVLRCVVFALRGKVRSSLGAKEIAGQGVGHLVLALVVSFSPR